MAGREGGCKRAAKSRDCPPASEDAQDSRQETPDLAIGDQGSDPANFASGGPGTTPHEGQPILASASQARQLTLTMAVQTLAGPGQATAGSGAAGVAVVAPVPEARIGRRTAGNIAVAVGQPADLPTIGAVAMPRMMEMVKAAMPTAQRICAHEEAIPHQAQRPLGASATGAAFSSPVFTTLKVHIHTRLRAPVAILPADPCSDVHPDPKPDASAGHALASRRPGGAYMLRCLLTSLVD